MRRLVQLAAGLADSGFASLGTFLAGVVAVRELNVQLLAVYAVLAASTVFAMPLARQLVYLPSQVASNLQDDVVTPVLRRELRRALPLHLLSAAIVLIIATTLLPGRDGAGVLAIALTSAGFVIISPLQDHVRSCLHLVGWHRRAALCSAVLASVVALVAGIIIFIHLPRELVLLAPFGTLTLANLVSAALGTVLLRRAKRDRILERARFADRARFLASELGMQGAWMACTYLILVILGAQATASLEAARIAASPVYILSSASSTFLAPALLRRLSPTAPDSRGAVREVAMALVLLMGGAGVWLLFLAFQGHYATAILHQPFNFGLVTARALAASIEGAAGLLAIALLALRLARLALVASLLTAATGIVGTAILAPWAGPLALPLSQGAGNTLRFVLTGTLGIRAVRGLVRASETVW